MEWFGGGGTERTGSRESGNFPDQPLTEAILTIAGVSDLNVSCRKEQKYVAQESEMALLDILLSNKACI